MTSSSVYSAFLEEQHLALFDYLGDGVFRPIGSVPEFLERILGDDIEKTAELRLGDSMPFLENFIIEAEGFWNSRSAGRMESGAWIEKGSDAVEHALEASALWLAGRKVLLLQNPQQRFDEQVKVLQTARDSLLEHEKLLREIQNKEILLHCIVHDLSQPLTAIRGSLSLLKLQSMAPEFKEALEIAERQSEKQETMIRGILEAFSAELASQRAVESDPNNAPDLALCAQRTAEAFKTAFQERGAKIALSSDLDLGQTWRVKGEESRLLRIFGNLTENALRHSPPGSTLTLGVSGDESFLTGYVDDEGPGLPEGTDAPRLFALFAKGKGERAGKAGLGLYFCKITVERWGGTIGCENRPNVGARFWFRLPRLASEHTHDYDGSSSPVAQLPDRVQVPAECPRHPLRILLTEDDAIIRKVVSRMLRERGHKVTMALDGKDALDKVRRRNFDVVLLDAEMPRMGGIDTARAIRKQEKASGQHMPIVGMTAYATEAERARCLEAGMNSCLRKPFSAEDLYQSVECPMVKPPESVQAMEERPDSAESWQETLLTRTGGKPRVLASLTRLFLADCPKKLSRIKHAIRRGDGKLLASEAHSLRGSVVLIFGDRESAGMTRKLEAMGRSGDMAGASGICNDLERDLARLCGELGTLQKSRPAN